MQGRQWWAQALMLVLVLVLELELGWETALGATLEPVLELATVPELGRELEQQQRL
jgi:hypothetical protein